jgi:copper homeostasis protein
MTRLEIVATCAEDAVNAEEGGAHSVEIALDLTAHGITPPLWLVEDIRRRVDGEIHVILRPHADSFVYDSDDIHHILEDARTMSTIGIDGFVFGAHTPEGDLDLDLIKRVRASAPDMRLTIHRAIDECRDPLAALEGLRGVADRVLTSGGTKLAWDGRDTLRDWVRHFGKDYTFIAGGGITHETARAIAEYTGVNWVHIGRSVRGFDYVDADRVRAVIEALED